MRDKTVALSKYNELPDFPAQTAVNVQFGILGVASAISSGNAMIRNNNIEDPAFAISRQLADGMKVNHNIKVVEPSNHVSVDAEVSDLVGLYQDYDFVLDVKTIGWSSIYFPSDWDSYRVMYTAHARLIDIKSNQIVAEELCAHVPDYEDTNQAPSYEQLEDGTGLQVSLAKSVEYCVDHIRNMAKLHHEANKDKLAVVE